MSQSRSDLGLPPAARAPWERPSVTFVGELRGLVRGTGKVSGEPNDSDAQAFNKSPGQT